MRSVQKWFIGVVVTVASLLTSLAHAQLKYNMSPGVTPLSRDIFDLHMIIFWICVAIGVLVYGVLIYSLVKFRKSKGAKAASFHDNTRIEIIWTIIPCLILILLEIPSTKTLIHMSNTDDAEVNVLVTGYQWKWKYEYLDQGISFFSNLATTQDQINGKQPKSPWYLLEVDHPLVLPVGKKIRFIVTANDVIHSWWVPELGVKRDAIPGFVHESWAKIEKPGIYRGQCTELCGVGHGYMPIVVDAKPQQEYDKWVKQQQASKAAAAGAADKQWTRDELMEKGKTVYGKICAVCHMPNGAGMPPAFPALKGSAIALGPASKHIDIVLHGKSGSAMQAFGEQLDDAEIAAVVTYEREAWGNDAKGDKEKVIQPSQIKDAR